MSRPDTGPATVPSAVPAAPGPGARPGSRLGSLAGLTSQLLCAATNVATAYAGSLLLDTDAFGRFVLAFACVTVLQALGRGLIGATMLAHLPAVGPDERGPLTASAVGYCLIAGVVSAAVLLAASPAVGVLLWFVPWVPFALVQDLGRHVFLARGRPGDALALDVVWALAQVATVAVWWAVAGSLTLGALATGWGVGALAGAVAYLLLDRSARPASPRRWARATRDVAGWFTATSVLGQAEIYIVLLVAGALLGPAETGGLRAVQLLALQPPLVLLGAVLALATPPVARLGPGSPGLRRLWWRTTLAVSPVAVAVLGVAALAVPLMALLFPAHTAFAPLVVPVALQAALTAFTVPSLALLAGVRRGARSFAVHAARTSVLVIGAALGGSAAGATGLAWSLALTTGLGVAALIAAALPLLTPAHPIGDR